MLKCYQKLRLQLKYVHFVGLASDEQVDEGLLVRQLLRQADGLEGQEVTLIIGHLGPLLTDVEWEKTWGQRRRLTDQNEAIF